MAVFLPDGLLNPSPDPDRQKRLAGGPPGEAESQPVDIRRSLAAWRRLGSQACWRRAATDGGKENLH